MAILAWKILQIWVKGTTHQSNRGQVVQVVVIWGDEFNHSWAEILSLPNLEDLPSRLWDDFRLCSWNIKLATSRWERKLVGLLRIFRGLIFYGLLSFKVRGFHVKPSRFQKDYRQSLAWRLTGIDSLGLQTNPKLATFNNDLIIIAPFSDHWKNLSQHVRNMFSGKKSTLRRHEFKSI